MLRLLIFLMLTLPLPLAAQSTVQSTAQSTAQETEVDLELFLAVDVSRSMSPQELDIQRKGYAAALTSPEFQSALQGGLLGRIAITYVEWAEDYAQRVIVPWTLVDSPQHARAVAATLTAHYDDSLRRTSISGALDYASRAFDTNGFTGLRRVIDISGDGPNNQGRPVLEARADAIAKGITINGLPLMTFDALSGLWGIPDLDVYFETCVIGGPGAFLIPVRDWDQFPAAVRRKLVLEIAGDIPPHATPNADARIIKTQMVVPAVPVAPRAAPSPNAPYDCLIGEKMWDQNRSFLDIP